MGKTSSLFRALFTEISFISVRSSFPRLHRGNFADVMVLDKLLDARLIFRTLEYHVKGTRGLLFYLTAEKNLFVFTCRSGESGQIVG